eukprot:CAMPEP_0184379992 /NCGR_PEP_ID=MMETSP0007-20130409/4359_1 /TAXON_ID=97485 /ORGANISM="Prymnesium parvum, Strain Texoma1" /LENGTH=45 /DNA_ID= /DNA_START= /DNA_END= /DNA_ORIENTATION=
MSAHQLAAARHATGERQRRPRLPHASPPADPPSDLRQLVLDLCQA